MSTLGFGACGIAIRDASAIRFGRRRYHSLRKGPHNQARRSCAWSKGRMPSRVCRHFFGREADLCLAQQVVARYFFGCRQASSAVISSLSTSISICMALSRARYTPDYAPVAEEFQMTNGVSETPSSGSGGSGLRCRRPSARRAALRSPGDRARCRHWRCRSRRCGCRPGGGRR